MARISQELIARLERKLGLSRRQVYRRIEDKARSTFLDRELAAISVAADVGINIAKYTTPQQRAALRGLSGPQHPPSSAPITLIKKVQKPPEQVTLDLASISDPDLKQILTRDLDELNAVRSLTTHRVAKTCIVLCGSIAEALLLERVSRDPAKATAIASALPAAIKPRAPSHPDEWDLNELVNVATHWTPPLLPEDATTGAHQLRKWRNLIHPGREIRDAKARRIKPTKERADTAVAFLQFVGKELS